MCRTFVVNFKMTVKTGSSLQLRYGKSYRRDSNGYPHVFHHGQSSKVTGNIVRQLLLPYFDMADTKPEVVCNSGTEKAIDAIPTATPTFSTTPCSMESLSTLLDVSQLPEINMAAIKPEVVVSGERREISTKF